MANFRQLDVLKIMRSQTTGLTQNVFCTDRPKSVPENMNEFIVVSMPVMLYDKMVGQGFEYYSSYVRYEIYVKDVRGIENTKKLVNMTQSIIDSFFVNTDKQGIHQDGIHITNPRTVFKGTDGHGFHSTWIQATLSIY